MVQVWVPVSHKFLTDSSHTVQAAAIPKRQILSHLIFTPAPYVALSNTPKGQSHT